MRQGALADSSRSMLRFDTFDIMESNRREAATSRLIGVCSHGSALIFQRLRTRHSRPYRVTIAARSSVIAPASAVARETLGHARSFHQSHKPRIALHPREEWARLRVCRRGRPLVKCAR